MKTINLNKETLNIADLINLARKEPVLLLAPDGQQFLLAEVDDFEREVDILRTSPAFQQFLDERSSSKHRIPLEELEREIEQELAAQQQRE
jgi:hypothetical protein